MTTMLPGEPVSKAGYIVRAAIAVVLVGAFSFWMIARSTGLTDSDPVVHTEIPVAAGLITAGAPVRYHGVKVGEIVGIEAGARSSRVDLALDEAAISSIPDTVVVRVLPRTFFGDIYLQLADRGATPPAQRTAALVDGDEIAIDASPEAVNLYDIFTKLTSLIDAVEPQKITVALAAVNKAIGGRGAELGVMIDQWTASSRLLEEQVNEFIDATPQFRRVAESLQRATPAVTETLASMTSLSRGILDNQSSVVATLTAASGYLDSVGPFVADQRKNLVTIIDSTATILSTVADNPRGLSRTLSEANKFAQSGAQVFATGRFNITAVPTFSEPMPYTAADCPTYSGGAQGTTLRGAQCTGTGSARGRGAVRAPGAGNGTILEPVIDGTGERPALNRLQGVITPSAQHDSAESAIPNPATVLMIGPMVRGAQVELK